jgi:hypothetical protein
MYLELSDEIIKKIEKITNTDYEVKGNLIPAENVEAMIQDLLTEIDGLQEKLEDILENTKITYEPDYDEIGKDIRLGIYD